MSGNKRRFFERNSAPPTFLGAESVFVGDLRCAGHVVVSGEVRGDGDIGGCLNISASGTWHGIIHAHQAIIAGTLNGGLEVKDRLEIGSGAVIRGNISARTIAIANGAIVDGEIVVTSGSEVVEFEEKRSSRLPGAG